MNVLVIDLEHFSIMCKVHMDRKPSSNFIYSPINPHLTLRCSFCKTRANTLANFPFSRLLIRAAAFFKLKSAEHHYGRTLDKITHLGVAWKSSEEAITCTTNTEQWALPKYKVQSFVKKNFFPLQHSNTLQ